MQRNFASDKPMACVNQIARNQIVQKQEEFSCSENYIHRKKFTFRQRQKNKRGVLATIISNKQNKPSNIAVSQILPRPCGRNIFFLYTSIATNTTRYKLANACVKWMHPILI